MTATAEQFAALGVSGPEDWARSQQLHGINQIARATAFRALADIVAESPALWQVVA